MINLYDDTKQGTIILSHYRSGGTQLLLALTEILLNLKKLHVNLKELDFDITSGESFITQTEKLLWPPKTRYTTVLLNNSMILCNWYNRNYFDELNEKYNLVVLERKNKLKCLLSLPVWEQLIKHGLYDKKFENEHDKKEAMIKFHEHLLENPIPYNNIHLGWENDIFTKKTHQHLNEYYYMNYLLKAFQEEINTLHCIESKYNLKKIWYEDYEHDSSNLHEYFQNVDEEVRTKALKDTDRKIPYVTNNFLEYFDEFTKQTLLNWNFDD